MARKKKTRIQLDQSSGFGSSLGAQLGLSAPAVDESNESLQSHTVVKADEVCVYSIQLRISRKGYGGKTVTECRGLGGADEPTTVALTRSLAKRLGACDLEGGRFLRTRRSERASGYPLRSYGSSSSIKPSVAGYHRQVYLEHRQLQHQRYPFEKGGDQIKRPLT